MKFSISVAPTARRNYGFDEHKIAVDDFGEWFEHKESNKKDGECFVPGLLVGGERKNPALAFISMLVYDIDGGMSFEELDKHLDNLGRYALMYTTFSHKTTRTDVPTDAYAKYAEGHGEPATPTLASITAYFKAKGKDHLLDKNLRIDPDEPHDHTPTGQVWVFRHDPIDKMRVVFPLEKPIVMRDLDIVNRRAWDSFKAIYKGVGQAFNLPFDEACADPARLYFFPSHKPGADFGARLYDGPLLKWGEYPRATDEKAAAAEEAAINPANYMVKDKTGRFIDLMRWDRQNRFTFDLENCLQDCLPVEMQRKERNNGGFHIECPFEDEHTNPGEGQGTYCVNADDERPWLIYCSHNTCQNEKRRRRMDFLKAFIEQGHITAVNLGLTEDAALHEAAGNLGIDATLLPHNLKDDVLKDADESHVPYLAALKDAETVKAAVDAFTAIKQRNIELPDDDVLDLLAAGPLDLMQIKDFAGRTSTLTNMYTTDVVKGVTDKRQASTTLDDEVQKLIAQSFVSDDMNRRLNKLRDRYGWGKVDLNRANKRIREQLDEHVDPTLREHLKEFERWGKTKVGSSAAYIDMDSSWLEATPVLQNKKAMELMHENKQVSILKRTKDGPEMVKVNSYKHWSTECDIKSFDGLTFDPNKPKITDDGKFNLWSGFKLEPLNGGASIITDHIHEVWCDGDDALYGWVMTWLSNIFQDPGKKWCTALMFTSIEGTGKSIILDNALSTILNPYHLTVATKDDILNKFNAHLAGKLFILGEEVIFSGDKACINQLKQKVSQPTIAIEKKGFDKAAKVPFHGRFAFTTNNEHIASLNDRDRRFCILEPNAKYVANKEYFARMVDWIEDIDNCRRLYGAFLDFNPGKYGLTFGDLYKAPDTKAKQDQREMSHSPGQDFFIELLLNGRVRLPMESVPASQPIAWPLDDCLEVKADDIKQTYDEYLKAKMGGASIYQRSHYSAYFKVALGKAFRDLRRMKRVNGVGTPFICTEQTRRQLLELAVAGNMIRAEDRDFAFENPNSHLQGQDNA